MTSPWVSDFDVFKQQQLGRLGVDEGSFLNQSWISFDSFRSEFDNLSKNWGDIWALDNFIGDQYRALRDTNQWLSNLSAQENATKRSLVGSDVFFNKRNEVQKLINQGVTDIDELASRTGYNANTVQSLIKNDIEWFKKASWTEVTLNSDEQERIKEDSGYNTAIERAQEDYDYNKSQWQIELDQIKQDFDKKISRQKDINNAVENNMNKIVWFSWAGYSNRGGLGIENILTQSKNIINDMQTLRSRAVSTVESYLDRQAKYHNRAIEDLQTGLSDSVMNATQSALAGIDAIKTKYGETSELGIQKLIDAKNKYVETINDYNNQTFENMQQQYNMLQSQIQLSTSVNEQETQRMNQQAEQLIDQWAGFNEILEMVNSGQITPQVGAKAQNVIIERWVATLNSFGGDGMGELFRDTIAKGLSEGKGASEVLQEITSSEEFANAVPEEKLGALDQARLQEQRLKNRQIESETWSSQWDTERNTGSVAWIGTGHVTAYWTEANPYGLDVDGINWESEVSSPANWNVVKIGNDPNWYWNYVTIEDKDGNQVRYAHLYSTDGISEWMSVWAGMPFAKIGNTGNVIPMNGWDGSHVDITLVDKNGRVRTAEEAEQYINSGGRSLWLSPTQEDNKSLILSRVKNKNYTPSNFWDFQEIAVKEWRAKDLENAQEEGLNDSAQKLRKEFKADKMVQRFEKVNAEFSSVVNVVERGDWPSDLATVFQFMKTLDPTSVVREGEFDNAAKTTGILDRLWPEQQREKASKWVILTPEQRKLFGEVMGELYTAQKWVYQQRRDDYISLSEKSGIDPFDVVLSDPSEVNEGQQTWWYSQDEFDQFKENNSFINEDLYW